MPHLPPAFWLSATAFALLLLLLCGATVYSLLRPTPRHRVAEWPPARIVALVIAAALPWLVIRFAPLHIKVSINGILQLVGWLLLAVLAFALLVLLPLSAIVSALVWLDARRRAPRSSPVD